MKTLKEIDKEIERLKREQSSANYFKNKILSAEITKLEWVKADSNKIFKRKSKLLEGFNSLNRLQKIAFNALRLYENKTGVLVSLDMLNSQSFLCDPDLYGFGEACKQEVLKHPELFLCED